MPVDPAHGRYIPAGRRIAEIVRRSLAMTRTAAVSQVRNGISPSIIPFVSQLYTSLIPEYERLIQLGARFSMKERAALRAVTRTGLDLSQAWTQFLPTVRPQAMNMSLRFVSEFAQTTQHAIREAVATGLEQGEALSRIQRRLMGITETQTVQDRVEKLAVFDRNRAYTVAATESSRAMHGGQAVYGRSIGSAGLEWIASSDACDICLSVNGKKVKHGEPFYVHTTGRPEYRLVYYPPMHPHCMCTVADWWEE